MIKKVEKSLALTGNSSDYAIVAQAVRQLEDCANTNKEYCTDLFLYHFKLRRFVVIELKTQNFDPRDVGQINFYLSVMDDFVRKPQDNPTIGIILCKTKNDLIVEYALQDVQKPIGVTCYETKLAELLPKYLKDNLPTIEKIEAELEKQELLIEMLAKK